MKKLLLLSLILSYGLHAMDSKLTKLQMQEIDDTVASGSYQYPTIVDNWIDQAAKNGYTVCNLVAKINTTLKFTSFCKALEQQIIWGLGPVGCIPEDLFDSDSDSDSDNDN